MFILLFILYHPLVHPNKKKVLIDDPNKTVVEPVLEAVQGSTPIYDFDLMTDAGHLTGYKVDDQKLLDGVADALIKLMEKDRRPLSSQGSEQSGQSGGQSSVAATPMV